MVPLKSPQEIKIMREGGKILAQIIKEIKEKIKPGVSTQELDRLAESLIFKFGAKPAFKGYQGFPASLCVSINEEVVHGVPSARKIKEGDIVKLDLGIFYKGFYSDMAVTVGVGSISFEARRLIRVTKKALKRAIKRMKPGKRLGDVSWAIQKYVEGQGFNVVRDLCGHGIGRRLHEDPEVLNFGQPKKGLLLKKGMVFAIEPMVVIGNPGVKRKPDGICYQTADGSLAAHFEHTVAVDFPEGRILTQI